MVGELLVDQSSEWEKTIRALPTKWTADVWRRVYNFPKEGKGLTSRAEKIGSGKFSNPVNPKDGYGVSDCIDPRERRMLEFLVPILNPDRPNRITVTLASTIFGALSGDRKVSWGVIFRQLVEKMVAVVGKTKPSALSPFLFHLYHSFELLRDKESTVYKAAEVMLKYDIRASKEPEEEREEREEREGVL